MKNQNKKNIYVVGGSGLLGKSIINALDNKENNIINLDIKKFGNNFFFF